MKSTFLKIASLFVFATLSFSNLSYAQEAYDPHLRGVNEGSDHGIVPPEGMYFRFDSYWASFNLHGNDGVKTPTALDALIVVPAVMWSTGKKVLGGDYAAILEQPMDYTNLKGTIPITGGTFSSNGQWGMYNTIVYPAVISWKVTDNLHLATALAVYLDDASKTYSKTQLITQQKISSGNGFYTTEPRLYASWKNSGWAVNADFYYDYNFKNSTTNYTSGQELSTDYSVTKQFGNLKIGMGGYIQKQITSDSGAGADLVHCPAENGCKAFNSGVGPLMTYSFGKAAVTFSYNRSLRTVNDFGGDTVNVNFVGALF